MPATRKEARAKILVVDDNEANRALATSTLEDEGYEVTVAAGGAEGIAAFERERPDCVLLDVRMPGMDGIAVCQRIRALDGGAHTPVLFLTAQRDVDTFDRAVVAGGDDFLTKPVRPTELVLRVESALKLRRMSVELREHYDLLRRQRDDLLRLQLHKERLIAFIVHDLKNPVNAMDLHAQVLLRAKGLPALAHESATQIRAQARQLTRMIMNLLDVSKADEGQLAPRPMALDLQQMVADVTAELDLSARDRSVTFRVSLDEVKVHADDDLLRRTLANLVENALRYAPVGTSVTIASTRTPQAVEVRVADSGRGVPEDMREKVFGAFVQVEAGAAMVAHHSRGLGLTFCKVAVEAHGGQIRIEDGSPGAVFCVRLPHGV